MDDCVICHEQLTQTQNIITLGVCSHRFHAMCIQTWGTINNTCPLCRRVFAEAPNIENVLPTLLAMAIIIPMEEQMQRISLAYAFIKLVLQYYPTSADFNQYKNLIIYASENLSIDNYRLPLLCYTNRTDLSKQCTALKNRFRELSGANLNRHPFVHQWKHRLLNHIAYSKFFYERWMPQQQGNYYLLFPQPHTS